MTSRSRFGSAAPVWEFGWRRATAALVVPLIAVLMLQIRYYAPHYVEDIDVAAPSTAEPLAISTSAPPVAIAPPQLSTERPAGSRSLLVEARPLRLSQGRAPPVV
jgi:hypothetical protein